MQPLGALCIDFLPEAASENPPACPMVPYILLKALKSYICCKGVLAASESLLRWEQSMQHVSYRSKGGGDAPGVFRAHVGINSSPGSSCADSSLTVLKQPRPAIAELISTSTGFELRGKGAACI